MNVLLVLLNGGVGGGGGLVIFMSDLTKVEDVLRFS